jgi:peptidoglycan/xylan/chitin deacetylase (PgdA/CDA1 family)
VIRRAIERLRRRERQNAPRSGRALILLYHRVARLRSDPWSLAVTPRRFEEHLEVLRREAHPIRLEQLSKSLVDGELPERAVVVTFDDGYADNLYNARPLLERYDVPATIFLPSGLIGGEREFWWDELERLMLQPGKLREDRLVLDLHGTTYKWQLGDATNYTREEFRRNRHWRAWEEAPTSRHGVYRTLWELLHPMSEAERWKLLDQLGEWAGVQRAPRDSHRLLSLEEVGALAREELVEIGAHTVTHPTLSGLPAEVQRSEILKSKADLEEIAGRPVSAFAYPFGRRSDYDSRTLTLVREGGFTCACCNFPGRVDLSSDRFELPRLLVQDWDGGDFAARLSWWLDD